MQKLASVVAKRPAAATVDDESVSIRKIPPDLFLPANALIKSRGAFTSKAYDYVSLRFGANPRGKEAHKTAAKAHATRAVKNTIGKKHA